LRGAGFKIKKVYPVDTQGQQIEFYKEETAKDAFKELESEDFMDDYSISAHENSLEIKGK
jgi:hypothetical protein